MHGFCRYRAPAVGAWHEMNRDFKRKKDMLRKTITIVLPVIATAVMTAGPALAIEECSTAQCLPGPGVFPLIALGIAGAIALARLRK